MPSAFATRVLEIVASIPSGRVMTYGLIAEVIADERSASGLPLEGGPRQVGTALARSGADVPWWRVVNVAGRTAPGHEVVAVDRLRTEGVLLRGDRVVVADAVWWPGQP